MAKEGVKIEFTLYWVDEDADCSKCFTCGDIIVKKKHSLWMQFGEAEDLTFNEVGIAICDSCWSADLNKT